MPFIARESFHAALPDGSELGIQQGQELPDGHPAVAGREHLFAEVVADAAPRKRRARADATDEA